MKKQITYEKYKDLKSRNKDVFSAIELLLKIDYRSISDFRNDVFALVDGRYFLVLKTENTSYNRVCLIGNSFYAVIEVAYKQIDN